MKKFLHFFFTTLGVIFFLLILGGVYLFVADPLEVRPLLFPTSSKTQEHSTAILDEHPLLNPAQEEALENLGIDPGSLPSKISPETEVCFVEKLGEARVNEIKMGDAPSPFDLLKAGPCL